MREKVVQEITTLLDERVQRIEQQLKRLPQEEKSGAIGHLWDKLQHLSRLVEGQTTQHRTDEPLLERVVRLEKWVRARESVAIDRVSQHMPPKATMQVRASRYSVDPEEVAVSLLDLIEPEGRSSPLARMAGLNDWLRKNYPSILAEPIGVLNQDLWRLVVLTSDQKTGIVTPALDSIVGPQESLKWFEGGRYDGTQALVRANVAALAKAVRDEETQTWRPRLKGKIDLT